MHEIIIVKVGAGFSDCAQNSRSDTVLTDDGLLQKYKFLKDTIQERY